MKKKKLLTLLLLIIVAVYSYIDLYGFPNIPKSIGEIVHVKDTSSELLNGIPEYSGKPSYVLNNNKAEFTDEEYKKAEVSYIELSELDWLGRCGLCEASLNKHTLPTEERGDISSVYPSGWKQEFYPDLIEKNEGALYNRCHLLMYAMTGLNDDNRNLITGTEYMNTKGMLPYEKAVQNWIIKKSEGGNILYRVTPVFKGNELVARGVHIEAADVETKGSKFHINAYCYNVEPGIHIDYSTGKSDID